MLTAVGAAVSLSTTLRAVGEKHVASSVAWRIVQSSGVRTRAQPSLGGAMTAHNAMKASLLRGSCSVGPRTRRGRAENPGRFKQVEEAKLQLLA
jgi:hypothetical protein